MVDQAKVVVLAIVVSKKGGALNPLPQRGEVGRGEVWQQTLFYNSITLSVISAKATSWLTRNS